MTYAVQPRKLIFEAGEWFRSLFLASNLGCSGCASAFTAGFLLVLSFKASLIVDADFGVWLRYFAFGSILTYLLITLLVYVGRKANSNRAEAQKLTAEALAIMKGVKEHSEYLSYKAQTTAQALKAAAFELQEGAFAPFWDAIEHAAADLGECHASCQWLSANTPRFDDLLRQREHNFPDCFDGIEAIPDCRPLLEEFYRLVRFAQKDFRFANIWEHRQTRKVLIAGFATLGEAIKSLEATVVRSIADLKKTIEARTFMPPVTGAAKGVILRAFLPLP